MSPKRSPLTPREVVKMLRADGWEIKRKGPGDHVQYTHPTKSGKVTVDMGTPEFPIKTLKSIFKQAGWDW
ncbi:type II toxin-antitoxin system HicA family toxin [Brucella sp. IR073]|uniref:type II toxin-antitoxin system HicA family toxin n=1 Tax=unclassified Brucella TaxID=2632610 RepID=UPI003B9827C7